MTIPKFIKDIAAYFITDGNASATTEDQFQALIQNEHSTLECLVTGLWQPEATHSLNDMVRSPNMQGNIFAVCTTAGTSGTNEPDWTTTSGTVTDGSVVWTKQPVLNRMVITGDVSGETNVETSGTANLGLTLINKVTAGRCGDSNSYTANNGSFTTPFFDVDAKGRVTGYSTRTITLPPQVNVPATGIGVSASTQGAIDFTFFTTGNSINGAGYMRGSVTNTGLGAGTYTLQALLQSLVNLSHSHSQKDTQISKWSSSDPGPGGGG